MRGQSSLGIALALCAAHAAYAAPAIFRRGLFTMTIGDFQMPDKIKPNESGPLVFSLFDLDTAMQLPRTLPTADGGLALAAVPATFSLSAPPGMRMVDAGASAPSYERCAALMSSSAPNNAGFTKTPTNYFCTKTTEGRIARVRVYDWKATYKPDSFVSVAVRIECRVWST